MYCEGCKITNEEATLGKKAERCAFGSEGEVGRRASRRGQTGERKDGERRDKRGKKKGGWCPRAFHLYLCRISGVPVLFVPILHFRTAVVLPGTVLTLT